MPETARAVTSVFGKPVLTALQLVPLSLESQTPPPKAPAKRFVPETARTVTSKYIKPVLTAVQLPAPSVER